MGLVKKIIQFNQFNSQFNFDIFAFFVAYTYVNWLKSFNQVYLGLARLNLGLET